MKRKLISLLLVVSMVSSMGMSGCSKKKENTFVKEPSAAKTEASAQESVLDDTDDSDTTDEEAGTEEAVEESAVETDGQEKAADASDGSENTEEAEDADDAGESDEAAEEEPEEVIELTEEDYQLIAPENTDQSEKIAAMPKYDKEDTWAFYIYMIGSNLESQGIDELSELTRILVGKEAAEISDNIRRGRVETLRNFAKEVIDCGADLPKRLYNPVETKPDDELYYVSEDEEEADAEEENAEEPEEEYEEELEYNQPTGCASENIKQMLKANYNDTTKVIIETGGSTRWEDSRINPNRSQRFLIDSNGMKKIYDSNVVNMGSRDELADFLNYCTTNYSADHEVVFFWDHGSGILGYGSDEIFGDSSLSLDDLEKAFLEVLGKRDIENPHFEAIGFDACLMASLEATDSFAGFAKYLYASEEIEPGTGWDYTAIFNALYEDPEMNGAQLGKALADAFIKYSIDDMTPYGVFPAVTFSIMDLSKTRDIREAYAEFAGEALKNSLTDKKALAEVSRAAAGSVSYGADLYDVFNTIDLGRFMECLPDSYEEQKEKVLTSISDTVLYSRNSTYMEGSQGISVYFPQNISTSGMMVAGLYLNDISDNMDINALYYYKLAGCLNDTYSKYAKKAGYGEAQLIDYSIMEDFAAIPVETKGDGNLSVTLTEDILSLAQSVQFGIAKCDPDTGNIVYYGDDAFAALDEDGEISTFFEGKWITYGGVPLELEVISSNPDAAILKSNIIYNGYDAYMLIAYDAQDMEAKLLGIGYKQNEVTPDRNLMQPEEGDSIIILKNAGNIYDSSSWCYYKTIEVDDSVKLEEKTLEDGFYYEYISLADIRSDIYSSQIASFKVSGGKITDHQVEEELYQYYKD